MALPAHIKQSKKWKMRVQHSRDNQGSDHTGVRLQGGLTIQTCSYSLFLLPTSPISSHSPQYHDSLCYLSFLLLWYLLPNSCTNIILIQTLASFSHSHCTSLCILTLTHTSTISPSISAAVSNLHFSQFLHSPLEICLLPNNMTHHRLFLWMEVSYIRSIRSASSNWIALNVTPYTSDLQPY